MKIKSILSPIIAHIVLFLIQYIILPHIIHIFPSDIERSYTAICLTTMFVVLIGMAFFSDKLRYWFLGMVLYGVLIFAYHPMHIYGIGYGMFSVYAVSVIILIIIVALVEIIIWICIKTIKKIYSLFQKR